MLIIMVHLINTKIRSLNLHPNGRIMTIILYTTVQIFLLCSCIAHNNNHYNIMVPIVI